MSVRIFHISDLHFSPSATSDSYDINQLMAIQRKYTEINKDKKVDRVIVTGDLTSDAHEDSFIRAKTWLMGTVLFKKDIKTGLNLENDVRLKVMPGNKDFNFGKLQNQKFPEIYFEGLNDYNEVFRGNHTFFDGHPILYDWFGSEKGSGLLLIYLNTSLFGEDDSNKKLKDRFTDYTCDQIKTIVNKGLQGDLKISSGSDTFISSDQFRTSFKVLVSHHSLQSQEEKNVGYLNTQTKQRLLSNLGIMDFQIQLSGHNHIHEQPQQTYYKLMDDRAKNRFIFNELKLAICGPQGIEILKSSDGRKYSNKLSLIIQTVYSLVDPKQNKKDRSIINEVEKVFQQKDKLAASYLQNLIVKGVRNLHFTEEDKERAQTYFNQLDDLTRAQYEQKAKKVLKELIDKTRKKTLVNFNAGSAAIPHNLNPDQKRHFNVYDFESDELGTTFIRHHYTYNPHKKEFELEGKPHLFKYDTQKIPQLSQ